MSIYRITIPNMKPNDGARLVKDDVMCKERIELKQSPGLFKCVQ